MIEQGDVFRIKMYPKDGITPKRTNSYRYKYMVIIGCDNENCYAALVTNTKDHRLVPVEFQYPLRHNGYNCFVNCFKMFYVSTNRLTRDCYDGKISNDDLELIIECVKSSHGIKPEDKMKYGIT
jgi:hypothetical protein